MRTTLNRQQKGVRTAVVALAAVSTLGLTACSSDTAGTEEGADVEDVTEDAPSADGPFEGPYDTEFLDDVDSYLGEEVTLSADVNEVISSSAFTIAGTDDTTVEELLVLGVEDTADLAPETTVEVTGTVQEDFNLAEFEEELGVEMDDDLFAAWEEDNYIMAESVEILENVD